jgi:hypothetical protein
VSPLDAIAFDETVDAYMTTMNPASLVIYYVRAYGQRIIAEAKRVLSAHTAHHERDDAQMCAEWYTLDKEGYLAALDTILAPEDREAKP